MLTQCFCWLSLCVVKVRRALLGSKSFLQRLFCVGCFSCSCCVFSTSLANRNVSFQIYQLSHRSLNAESRVFSAVFPPISSGRRQDVNSTLYFALLSRHTYECMPFVYTPVVGEACQKFSQIYRHTPQASATYGDLRPTALWSIG